MIKGCDISFYQDNNRTSRKIDFNQMKSAGAEFVIIRYNQGWNADEDLDYNYREAGKAGLLRGSYHLYDYRYTVGPQVDLSLDLLKKYPPEIAPWYDLEYVSLWNIPMPRAKSLNDSKYFLIALKSLGRTPYLYSNPNTLKNILRVKPEDKESNYLLEYPLAIAHYGVSEPGILSWPGWAFWQYTSNGKGLDYGAESGSIDLDYFNGTREQLISGWKPPLTWEEEVTQILRSQGFVLQDPRR